MDGGLIIMSCYDGFLCYDFHKLAVVNEVPTMGFSDLFC